MSNIEYIALYRKYRPKKFLEIVGQEHVTKALKNQVELEKVAHAYLFSGPRGTGKTSAAKILARAVNCINNKDGNPCNECEYCKGIIDGSIMDVIEIDAASNNSVDNVRDIRDEIIYTPSKTKFKVYIIDEVHMLSQGAFNALLKTLEEPPSHIIFILATTEPHKLPPTIISRCQRFDFKKIPSKEILKRLENIAKEINIKVEKEALELISHISDGSMRDALSIFDQSISLNKDKVTHQEVLSMVGIVDNDVLFDFSEAIRDKNILKVIEIINKISSEGKDINNFIVKLMMHYRNLLLGKNLKDLKSVIDLSKEDVQRITDTIKTYSQEEIINIISILSEVLSESKKTLYSKILLETAVIKICKQKEDGIDKISKKDIDSVQPKNNIKKENIKEKAEQKSKGNNDVIKKEEPQIKEDASIEKEVLDNWENILKDMKEKGQSPLKIQYISNIKTKKLSDSTVILCVNRIDEVCTKLLQEKNFVTELKDSILKVVGKEINIRYEFKENVQEETTLTDEFKKIICNKEAEKLIQEK